MFLDFILMGISFYGLYNYENRQQLLALSEAAGTEAPVDPLPYLLGQSALTAQSAPDESNTAWSDEAVAWAVENGIIYGDGQGNLLLDEPCTRRQMVTFLHRFARLMGRA